MSDFIVKDGKVLKCGFTTGSCAAAASKAAVIMLLSGEVIYNVQIITPNGIIYNTEIEDIKIDKEFVSCAVRKNSGDDPDVTNGMLIYSKVRKINSEILIDGGNGIGRITKDGLKVQKGYAAINPIPMEMIKRAVKDTCNKYNYFGGIDICIYAPEGEKIAQKTFNSRLGIIGGISILGTTGIVEPMSEKAIVDTIKAEIDIRKNQNDTDILITVGNYAREFAFKTLGIDIDKGVKCSNFIGEALDYAVYCGFKKILLTGHSGKLIKLAAGIMNTHSKMADARMEIIAAHAALCGCNKEEIKEIMNCITTDEAFKKLDIFKVKTQVCNSIADNIEKHLRYRCGNNVSVDFIVFGDNNDILIKRCKL